MSALEIAFIAIGLSLDAFAVALAAGASGRACSSRAVFRVAFHFGLFQFLMPLLGWGLGISVAPLISSVDHWLAYGILGFLGARMIVSSRHPSGRISTEDPSRGMMLIMLSIATSLDAFAVGLSLALLGVEVFLPAVIIGLVACAFSFTGIRCGGYLGARFGRRMECAGGVILILIGLNILISHIMH